MDTTEALALLAARLSAYRAERYADPVARITTGSEVIEVAGESGVSYQIEIAVRWDGPAGDDVRVIGSVDDGGWCAFAPLTRAFIVRPDGSFVDEDARR